MDDFYQGNTVTIIVTLTDSAGDAVDITGSTLTLTIKKKKNDDALIQKVAVLTDPTNGQATFTLTDTDTDVTADRYVYDVEWVSAAGATKTVYSDVVNIFQPVKEA